MKKAQQPRLPVKPRFPPRDTGIREQRSNVCENTPIIRGGQADQSFPLRGEPNHGGLRSAPGLLSRGYPVSA